MDFVVNKQKLEETSTVSAPPLSLQEGDVLIRVEKFAFTANNVSYAATGDALGYWNFFPTTQANHNNRGRVPVWGTGTIVASRCLQPHLKEHQKVYGYFPMSHYVVLHPVQVTHSDFIDGSPHRHSLPAVYNQYLVCDEDPFYTPRTEEAMMVLRPLFFTSWLLLDFFVQQHFWGANTVIISAASSKTSIGLAFVLQQYNNNQQQEQHQTLHIVGLTSRRNLQFVQSLQVYDQIIVYQDLEEQLDSTQPACFVDMAGNTRLTSRLHHYLQHNIKYSCLVGAAHMGQGGKPSSKLPGARPKFFFAPSWTAQRIVELGGGNNGSNKSSKRRGLEILLHCVLIDYQRFVRWSLGSTSTTSNHPESTSRGGGQGWLHMEHFHGPEQVAKGYSACLRGEVGPDTAVIMSLWSNENEAARSARPTQHSRL